MIELTLPQNKCISVEKNTIGKDILSQLAEFVPSKNTDEIVALRINNEICQLNHKFEYNSRVEPVLLATSEGANVYRRTLCFVLAVAAHELLKDKRLIVGHSLGHGYYYTIDSEKPILESEIKQLENRMKEIASQNLQIEQSLISYEEAIELLEKQGLYETRKQLKFMCPPHVKINSLNNFSDLNYAPLLDTTGQLKVFDLIAYGDGFLLRFPFSATPEKLEPLPEMPQLFSVYKRYKDWGKLIGVTSAPALNEIILDRKYKDFINITETLQQKCFAEAADAIHKKGNVRVVLIAGPSSSGKTTSSKKLMQQLRVIGYKPHAISLDDYYVCREDTPRDENGNYDYECLEALDVKLLNDNLVDLFAGKEVDLPTYNFVEGKRKYNGKKLKLEKNDILILEGIHGLNEKLTPLIDSSVKFKIYVSALTQLNLDDLNRIATSDNRLIRRIVRDSQFRGKSAADTISMWPSVQKGERLHIFPFQNNADLMINTALDYELSVLRVYAAPLLRCVTPLQKEYAEACRLLNFLTNFIPIPADYVPGQSLIREFIGGSEFKY